MKWSFLYFVTFLSVLCGSGLGDYIRQNNNGYPVMRSYGNGYRNGIDYGYRNGNGYGNGIDYEHQNGNSYRNDIDYGYRNGNGYGNGNGYRDHNGYGYAENYYRNVNYGQPSGYNTRPDDYYRYHNPYYTQDLWLNAAPLSYQKTPKFGDKYYDNLSSRKHDRSLLENLNNYPVTKH